MFNTAYLLCLFFNRSVKQKVAKCERRINMALSHLWNILMKTVMPLESEGGQSVYYHLQETSKFEFGLWAPGKRKTELNRPDRNLLAFGRSLHLRLRTYTWPFPPRTVCTTYLDPAKFAWSFPCHHAFQLAGEPLGCSSGQNACWAHCWGGAGVHWEMSYVT